MLLQRADDGAHDLERLARGDGDLVEAALPVQHHRGHLEPPLVRGLVALRRAVEPREEGGGRRGGEDGHAGDLVVAQDVEELVRVGVAHLHPHARALHQLHDLGLDHHEVHVVLPRPLCDSAVNELW